MKLALAFLITLTCAAGTLEPTFNESSFDYKDEAQANAKTFCYKDKSLVCSEIRGWAYEINARYYQGAHDSMQLQSCGQSQKSPSAITATYILRDDYSNEFNVTREVEACLQALYLITHPTGWPYYMGFLGA